MNENDQEKLYSLKEVAEMLRVSERSMFRYIHSGKLKANKVGGWKISESELKAFLSDNPSVTEGQLTIVALIKGSLTKSDIKRVCDIHAVMMVLVRRITLNSSLASL